MTINEVIYNAFDLYWSAFCTQLKRRPTKWEANDWLIQSFNLSISEVDTILQNYQTLLHNNEEQNKIRTNQLASWPARTSLLPQINESRPLNLFKWRGHNIIADYTANGIRCVASIISDKIGRHLTQAETKEIKLIGPINKVIIEET